MEQGETKLPEGTWAKLPVEEQERKPKVEFPINQEKELILMGEPREFVRENGAFYVFDVEEYNKKTQKMEEKVIVSSAWTLIAALKRLTPLENRRVKITKVMDKGKQMFQVKAEQQEEQVED